MVLGFFECQWSASSMPNLSGRVAIVTGGNTGIGYVTCLELARKGARVYMASRTEQRATEAIARIKSQVSTADVRFLHFDLTQFASATKAAESFMKEEARLDILVNNAGIAMAPYELGPDGIEVQACNGTGHFALTTKLFPVLRKTAGLEGSDVRIVTVSSEAHRFTWGPDFSSLEGLNQASLNSFVRYGHSKLSNIVFTNELQLRLDDCGIICLSVHPGTVATELPRGGLKSYPYLAPLMALNDWILTSPKDGAITQLYAATAPEVKANRQKFKAAYLIPSGKLGSKSTLAQDKAGKLGRDFWSLCEKLMAEKDSSGPN